MLTATAASTITGRNFIAGRWRASGDRRLESHNPAHWTEILGTFPKSSEEEVAQAVLAAREAFPVWRRTSRIHRAELFDNLAQLVKRDGRATESCRAKLGSCIHSAVDSSVPR